MIGKSASVGDLLETDRYNSTYATLDTLEDGGAIFLVTVRPPDEKLWLVGIIEDPTRDDEAWVGAANAQPIVDVTAAIKKLQFESRTGLKAKKGALGMSLQTPRALTEDDVALLRGFTGGKAKKPAKAAKPAKAPKIGKLRLDGYRKPLQMIGDLRPSEKTQLEKLIKEQGLGKTLAAAAKSEGEWMELLDVVDDKTNAYLYQLYLYSSGSGALFEHAKPNQLACIAQHAFELHSKNPALHDAIAAAYSDARDRFDIKQSVSFEPDDDDDDDDWD